MPGHANIETLFVTLQRIITKQLGSDLFLCILNVLKLCHKLFLLNMVLSEVSLSYREWRIKLPSDIFSSKPAHVPAPLPLTWCQAELRLIPGSPCALKPQLNSLFKCF